MPERRRPPARGPRRPAGRGDRRHPAAADPHRRGPARGARDAGDASSTRRVPPLPVRRARARTKLLADSPRASATSSRTGSPTSTSSSPRSGGSQRRIGTRSVIVSTLLASEAARRPLSLFTPREREVLELMATGSRTRDREPPGDHGAGGREVRLSVFGKLGLPRGQRVATGAGRARVPALLTRERRGKPKPAPRAVSRLPRGGRGCDIERAQNVAKGAAMKNPHHPGRPEASKARKAVAEPAAQMQKAKNVAGRWRLERQAPEARRPRLAHSWSLASRFGRRPASSRIDNKDAGVGQSHRADRSLEGLSRRERRASTSSSSPQGDVDSPAFRSTIKDVVARVGAFPRSRICDSPLRGGHAGQIAPDRPRRHPVGADRRRRSRTGRSTRSPRRPQMSEAQHPDFFIGHAGRQLRAKRSRR